MDTAPLSLPQLTARLNSASTAEELSVFFDTPYILITLEDPSIDALASIPYTPSCPIIAIADRQGRADTMEAVPGFVDVVVETQADAGLVATSVTNNPIASMLLVQLLRHNESVDVFGGLFAESLAYSTLQHGAEFQSWLSTRKPRPPVEESMEPAVLVTVEEDELRLTLNRPDKRNAYSAAMRDALCEGLRLLADDSSLRHAVLSGAGPCFCAGGDLDEFGEASDAGLAHASRVTRSAGALIHSLRDRIEVHLHGACIGAGIELPAFAGHIKAREDAFFQLPEVSFGLVPGAGGTVSMLPRIGRHRLAFMALTGARVDVETAYAWGLVDEIVGSE